MVYINFYFKELKMNDNIVKGVFDSTDNDVYCKFEYDINTRQFKIFDNNKPIEDITPIPFYWINKKLEENGILNEIEAKISY